MERLLTSVDLAQFGAAGAAIGILLFVVWMQWRIIRDLREDLKEERAYNRQVVKMVQDQQISYIQTLRNLQENIAVLLDRA